MISRCRVRLVNLSTASESSYPVECRTDFSDPFYGFSLFNRLALSVCFICFIFLLCLVSILLRAFHIFNSKFK